MKQLMYSLLFVSAFIYNSDAQPVSAYEPDGIDNLTNEIVDSLFTLMEPSDVHIADSRLKDCDYIKYWNKYGSEIPKEDFLNLINHPSAIIRYHSYRYILDNDLVSSKREFIIHHLADLEYVQYVTSKYQLNELTWILKDSKWVKSGPGFQPLIVHLIHTIELAENEREGLYRTIIQENNNSSLVTEFPLNQLRLNEENYSVIKSLALSGNVTAIGKLAEYQKEENQDFLLSYLDSTFLLKTDRENRKFIEHSVKYDYPKGSIDRFLSHYKQNESEYIRYKHLYLHYAKDNTPIRKNLLNQLILKASVATETEKDKIHEQIKSHLKKTPDGELIDFRIEFWKESGWLECSSVHDINKRYPDVALEIAKAELVKLERDEFEKVNCYRKLISIIVKKNLSPEKYINWGLQSEDGQLLHSALALSGKYPFPSNKALVLSLMKPDCSPIRLRRIIDTLVEYDLSDNDRRQILEWVEPFRDVEESSKYPYPLEENLKRMGIK